MSFCIFGSVCLVCFMLLHALSAGSAGDEDWLPWLVVFGPLLLLATAALFVVLFTPFSLPRDGQPTLQTKLLVAVTSASTFGLAVLSHPSSGPHAVTAALLPFVVWLAIRAAQLTSAINDRLSSVGGVRAGQYASYTTPGGSGSSRRAVGGYALAYRMCELVLSGATVWLLYLKMGDLKLQPPSSVAAENAEVATEAVAQVAATMSWWVVASPLLVLQVTSCFLGCHACCSLRKLATIPDDDQDRGSWVEDHEVPTEPQPRPRPRRAAARCAAARRAAALHLASPRSSPVPAPTSAPHVPSAFRSLVAS